MAALQKKNSAGDKSKLETVELIVWLLRVSDSILISFSKSVIEEKS